jgi:hypothetical protein
MQPPPPPPSPGSPKSWIAAALFLALGFAGGAFLVSILKENLRPAPAVRREARTARPAARPAAPAARPAAPAPVPRSGPPRVAIVLDDWGYNLNALAALREIAPPLTLAVLPGLPYSQRVARDGFADGNEIILHVPMEPKREGNTEARMLRAGMPEAELRALLRGWLDGLPHVSGVSNHQGSKASEDPQVMRAVLETVRSRGYFYLDSMTTQASVAGSVARELGLPFLRRDVFLDNVRTEEAVQERLDELRAAAKRNGLAVGIGHDEPLTLEMIRRNVDAFERDGIEFVRLSELL